MWSWKLCSPGSSLRSPVSVCWVQQQQTADQTATWGWGKYFGSSSHWQTKSRGLHPHSDTVAVTVNLIMCICAAANKHCSLFFHQCSKADLNMLGARPFNAKLFVALSKTWKGSKIQDLLNYSGVEQCVAISHCSMQCMGSKLIVRHNQPPFSTLTLIYHHRYHISSMTLV